MFQDSSVPQLALTNLNMLTPRSEKKRKNTSSGDTLLEVLLAVTILGSVVISLISPFFSSFSLTANDQSNIYLNNFARVYFRDLGQYWSIQNNFDNGLSTSATFTYTYPYTFKTENGKFTYILPDPTKLEGGTSCSTTSTSNSEWGDHDIYNNSFSTTLPIVRRVHICFQDKNGNTIAGSGFYQDFNRPTSTSS